MWKTGVFKSTQGYDSGFRGGEGGLRVKVVIKPPQSTADPGSVVESERGVVGESGSGGERTAGANWRGRGEQWIGYGRKLADAGEGRSGLAVGVS